MTDLDEIRKQENEQVYKHLFAIRRILACKSKRDGADKAVADLFINGFFQFSFKDGLAAFGCQVIETNHRRHRIEEDAEQFEKNVLAEELVDQPEANIGAENRDIVRHLIEIRNIRNTKCARCNFYNCQGCSLSGREYFNVAAGLKLMMLYDWKAIYEVLGLPGYYDETDEYVFKLADCVGGGPIIKMAKPEYETNY